MKTICIYHSRDLDGEYYRKLPFNDNYYVSNKGSIYSCDMELKGKNGSIRKRIGIKLCQSYDKDGYLRVAINGKTMKSHRLIASAFIPNIDNLPEINHIDGNKINNDIDNLQWCNHIDNIEHSCENKLHKIGSDRTDSFTIIQLSLDETPIREFGSIREAERITGICNSTISKVCRGIGNSAGGYKWKIN